MGGARRATSVGGGAASGRRKNQSPGHGSDLVTGAAAAAGGALRYTIGAHRRPDRASEDDDISDWTIDDFEWLVARSNAT